MLTDSNLGENGLSSSNFRVRYEEEKDNIEVDTWSICLESFKNDPDKLLIFLPCDKRHIFHEECILSWLHRKKQCPLCKKRIITRPSRERVLTP